MTIYPVLVPIPQDSPVRTPEHVRQQRECARRALRECARRCGAPEDGWKKNAADVPLPQRGYWWSVSHKRKWAAAVIADHPVGIDIEEIVARGDELFAEIASDDEWKIVGERSWPAFFRVWTAKEATLKANGVGIAGLFACRVVDVSDGRHMTLEYEGRTWPIEHYYHAEHVAAVTRDDNDVQWGTLGYV